MNEVAAVEPWGWGHGDFIGRDGTDGECAPSLCSLVHCAFFLTTVAIHQPCQMVECQRGPPDLGW